MKLKAKGLAVAAIVTMGLLATPNVVAADDASPDDTAIEIPALPDTLTVEQMDELTSDGVIELTLPVDELNEQLQDAGLDLDITADDEPAATTATESGLSIATSAYIRPAVTAGVAGQYCRLDPGNMWSRSSGSGYAYGAIGSKPRLWGCTSGVVKTGIQSDVYRFNGWWWDKVAGTFSSYGTGNMQQKTVEYRCNGRGSNLYKVITTAWGTTNRGQTGVGRDSTGEYRFNCG